MLPQWVKYLFCMSYVSLFGGQVSGIELPEPEWQEVLPGDIQPVWRVNDRPLFKQYSSMKGKQELLELLTDPDSFLTAHAILVELHRPRRNSQTGAPGISSSKRVGMNFEVNYVGVRFSIVRTDDSGFITQKLVINDMESQMVVIGRYWRDWVELNENQDPDKTEEHNRTSRLQWKKMFEETSRPLDFVKVRDLGLNVGTEFEWVSAGFGFLRPRLSSRLHSLVQSDYRDVLMELYFRNIWSDSPKDVADAHVILSMLYCPSSIESTISDDAKHWVVSVNGIASKPVEYLKAGTVAVFDVNPRDVSQIRCYWAAVFDEVLPQWPEMIR